MKRIARYVGAVLIVLTASACVRAAAPVYIWLEPEWFPDVRGWCEYHSGPERLNQVQGHWGIAGPGISAEWTQGGESEFNSMAAGPNETQAVCSREVFVPRDGRYMVWVRYYDHRNKAEPFTVRVERDGKVQMEGELGVAAVAAGETPIATRHSLGEGAVILTLVPGMLGDDERAHEAWPYLINGLTRGLMPVTVTLANGKPLRGEAMYQLNRTKDGWLVALFNSRGVDKTQHGIARVDPRAFVDLVVKSESPIAAAKEWTQPRDLAVTKDADQSAVAVRVHPGDVQVIELRVRP
jgi:hypothetical protein